MMELPLFRKATLMFVAEKSAETAVAGATGGPEEACGFLYRLGNHPDTRVLWTRNGHDDPRHAYTIHSGDHLTAYRKLGNGIVGVWHSHVDVGPEPSGTDIATAVPGWWYLIYSVAKKEFTLSVLKPHVVAYPIKVAP